MVGCVGNVLLVRIERLIRASKKYPAQLWLSGGAPNVQSAGVKSSSSILSLRCNENAPGVTISEGWLSRRKCTFHVAASAKAKFEVAFRKRLEDNSPQFANVTSDSVALLV